MRSYLIKNTFCINEGRLFQADILIDNGIIEKIAPYISASTDKVLDAAGKWLFPGVIDGQVHFREPGLEHKADIYSESRAAVAGGVTSFIDMPNTVPNTLSMELLNEKYNRAKDKSLANYGFLLGVNADNIDEIAAMDTSGLLALTDDGLYFTRGGNLLVENPEVMEKLFAHSKSIIAIHAEKESIIKANEAKYHAQYGDDIPVALHPVIRSHEACYAASHSAIELAKKWGARLHILHLSSEPETHLFQNYIPLAEKKITTEASIHHLWFTDADYERLGVKIKWNPAVKTETDRKGLIKALLDDRIDIITTDHAPHTWEEKNQVYLKSMSGAPMVQHALNVMLELHRRGEISLEKIAEKMCHNPAVLYGIQKRGFIREGYYADLTLVDPQSSWTVSKDNLLYKCGWSPLEGTTFSTRVTHTFVNGNLVYDNGTLHEGNFGMPL
jgi:dihydroorotase